MEVSNVLLTGIRLTKKTADLTPGARIAISTIFSSHNPKFAPENGTMIFNATEHLHTAMKMFTDRKVPFEPVFLTRSSDSDASFVRLG